MYVDRREARFHFGEYAHVIGVDSGESRRVGGSERGHGHLDDRNASGIFGDGPCAVHLGGR
ncbi:hypothetical protein O7626_22295 [Micromonospora sp. WMMD1102]|uniref:hypothetical protein n=1 Tax=Micromonospora sp. WMMD1102 TaxID=3016105 RepID=UPI0024153AEE|nr:hypothetical protein [Micromonospora sp. WMMD1102]MDG4788619.1 hypothetical protein [Micromonospora sp. WMMD1102]